MKIKVGFNLLAGLILILVFMPLLSYSQGYKGLRRHYRKQSAVMMNYGIEAAFSNRAFKLQSNIPELHLLRLRHEGYVFGAIVGTEGAVGRVRHGAFTHQNEGQKDFKLNTLEAGVNLFPMQLLAHPHPIVKPYVLVSAERGKLKFENEYVVPVPPPPPPGAKNPCNCPCLPGDPDTPITQPEPAPAAKTTKTAPGSVELLRGNIGGGIQFHLTTPEAFFNAYIEFQYGAVLGSRTQDKAFKETFAQDQTVINGGIAFGVRRKRFR